MRRFVAACALTFLLLPGCRAIDEKYLSFPINSALFEEMYWDHAFAEDPEGIRLRDLPGGARQAAYGELVAWHFVLPVGWAWTAFDLAVLPFTLAYDDDRIQLPPTMLPEPEDETVSLGLVTDELGYIRGYWLCTDYEWVVPEFEAFHDRHREQIGDDSLHIARIRDFPWKPYLDHGFQFQNPFAGDATPEREGEEEAAPQVDAAERAYWEQLRPLDAY